ncbi:class I SAM-dependent methyltransferase [Azospirillum sp. ST 5-10]|uniref:class I SAM-dependent methyltransferase n=1 Tax=unclassified Azospirillum TaxID=2630922 RepID=UPI003F4A1FFC
MTKTDMAFAERKLFVERWVKAPLKVASVTPSGTELCRAMVEAAGAGAGQRVVELGPGTGPITSALLKAGVEPRDLLLLELDDVFARHLRDRHPGVTVVEGDARRIGRFAIREGWHGCDAVVSGLPLIALPLSAQIRIAHGAFEVMGPHGVFVQLTYGPFSPLNPALVRRLGLVARRFRWIARNLPPASVWTYRRRNAPPMS